MTTATRPRAKPKTFGGRVMAGGNVLPVFEPQKAVLDLGVLLMAGFVVWTRVLGCLFLARYPRRDTRLAFRLISSSRCALQDQISL